MNPNQDGMLDIPTSRSLMRVRWRRVFAFVVVGIILPIGAGCTSFWLLNRPSQANRRAIETRYTRWHEALGKKRFDDAYEVMSPIYRASHSLNQFSRDFESHGEPSLRLQSDYILRVSGKTAILLLYNPNGLYRGPDYEWDKIDSVWFLTGGSTWYVD